MRTCPKCNNANIPQNAKHCTKCGYEFGSRQSNQIFFYIIVAFAISIILISSANNDTPQLQTPTQEPNSVQTSRTAPLNVEVIFTATKWPATQTPTIKSVSQSNSQPSATTTADCPGAPRNHVAINDLVKVITSNGDRLVLRSMPKISSSTELMRLDKGTLLKIHDGPLCVKDPNTGIYYWFWEVKVKSNEKMGYIAEGDKYLYFIQLVR